MFPFKEDLIRFDFEVDEADEYMCNFGRGFKDIDSYNWKGVDTPMESDKSDIDEKPS